MEAPVGTPGTDQLNTMTVFPNPAEGTATVSFFTTRSGDAQIDVYSSLGEKVKSCPLGILPAGKHEIPVNVGDMKAGVYILKVSTGSQVYSRKVSVIK